MKSSIGVASGILPIASSTLQLCLAWRSSQVSEGNCWSTIGGMIKDDPNLDESDCAVMELLEETGYCGPIQLHHAFVYRKRGFRYHNFIGIVPEPFEFDPAPEYAFETSFILWMPYHEVLHQSSRFPHTFHRGLLALLHESKELIERFVA